MMGCSPRCYLPSFVQICLPVPEKKIFKGFLPYMGMAAILVMGPASCHQIFISLYLKAFLKKLDQIGKGVSEKIQFEFLAHLSHRLIGELIHVGYSWSSVRPSVSIIRRRRPQCSKIFFSETALPIKAKFYVEPPWVGGMIFCSRHLGHLTIWPPCPYMVKTIQKSSTPEPAGRFPRNLVCSIGDISPS